VALQRTKLPYRLDRAATGSRVVGGDPVVPLLNSVAGVRRFAMTLSRWQTVSQIFEAALDLPANERNIFVGKACAGDAELESEVNRLLAADGKAGSFLEHPALSTLPALTQLAVSPLLRPGTVVAGRFQIVRFIGQGGMGQVYEALDLELNSRIALKAIRPEIACDPRILSRFRREVQLTRMITHPNVCRTFDIERHVFASGESGIDAGNLTFLTMELLEGETLSARLRCKGPLAPAEALPLVLQMIDALAAAHAVGVIHRDFKPSNVLLVPSYSAKTTPPSPAESSNSQSPGSGISSRAPRVVVTDFGLARALATETQSPGPMAAASAATSLTGEQTLMGTLVYMAPEQFERGEASISSDIYSLGLVMFEMVTGRRPFADDIPFAEATKRLKQPARSAATLVPDLAPAWDAAISRCLTLDPKDRFGAVHEVAEALADPAAAKATRETKTAVHSVVSPLGSARGRKILFAAVLVVVILSLFALAFRHYWMKAEEAKLAEGSTVLLTNIQNGTGDKRFDDTTELVRRQLLQSPYFSLMDSDRIHKTLGEMVKPADAALDPQTAREVAMRNGVRRVVFGGVSRVGDSYVLDLDIEQPDNSPLRFRHHWENHWTWNMPVGNTSQDLPSGFLDAVRDSSDWIRREIGESANDIAREDAPPEDVTTANWEALSEYASAEKFRATNDNDRAIVALHKAITDDPNFAFAYTKLGDILNSLQRYREAQDAYKNAINLGQGHLTHRELDRLRGIYASDTWDYATADAAFHDYSVYYPNDYLGWFYRGLPLMMMGRVEEAIESLKTAAKLDSAKLPAPAHIARFELVLGNFEDASKWIQTLRDAGYGEVAQRIEGQSDFLQGRYDDAQILFQALLNSKDPSYSSYAYSILIRLYAEKGEYHKALEAVEQGLAADLKTGDSSHRADKLLDRAYLNCALGRYDSCIHDLQLSPNIEHSWQRSLAAATVIGQFAASADSSTKQTFVGTLRNIEAHLPADDIKPLTEIVRARVRGEVLLAQGLWQPALDEFRKADRVSPPSWGKDYLARALVIAAEHAADDASARQLREEALQAFAAIAQKPGLVWQWPPDFAPGYVSDQTLGYAKVAAALGRQKDAQNQLQEYITRRSYPDPDSRQDRIARALLRSLH
jgi:serine/threonine protein kinase/tetratricopeptide (TPR) repeat protein